MKHKKFTEIFPYTYYIKHVPTGYKYYGVRYGNLKLNITPAQDFAKKYFTSIRDGDFSWFARLFKKFPDQFVYRLHYTFDSIQESLLFESKILSKIINKSDWCNQCNILENDFINRSSFCCCIYCKKELDKGNFYLSHGDKCIKGPSYVKRCHSEEYKKHMSKVLKNRKFSDDTKLKMSISQSNRLKILCQFCNKEYDPGNYARYHNFKCKYFGTD